MRLLYCQICGDIISPHHEARRPRFCRCERHAIWWRDPNSGLVTVFDRQNEIPADIDDEGELCRPPRTPRAWILGLTNLMLGAEQTELSADDYASIIDAHPDTYMFKSRRSCVIRFRPGYSSDSRWERKLP